VLIFPSGDSMVSTTWSYTVSIFVAALERQVLTSSRFQAHCFGVVWISFWILWYIRYCSQASGYAIKSIQPIWSDAQITSTICALAGSWFWNTHLRQHTSPPGFAKTPFVLGTLWSSFGLIFAYLCVSACSPNVFKCTSDCDNHPIPLNMDLER